MTTKRDMKKRDMKKSFRKTSMTLATAGLGAAAILMSASTLAHTQYVYAEVLDSRPVYQAVTVSTPREQCWNEQIRVEDSRRSGSNTPVILSTIVGGALGNAVGNNKSSRRVGVVAGAVLGHSVGRDIVNANSRQQPARYQTVQHCELVNEYYDEERLMGYQVRYRYHGEEYSVRMDDHPGDRIRLRVQVEPVR